MVNIMRLLIMANLTRPIWMCIRKLTMFASLTDKDYLMDPGTLGTGTLYSTRDEALADGVENPVEIIGRPKDIKKISKAVKARRAKNKVAKASRKKNRN
jgi:hypothetical protein